MIIALNVNKTLKNSLMLRKNHASIEILNFKNFIYGKKNVEHPQKIKDCEKEIQKIKLVKKILVEKVDTLV